MSTTSDPNDPRLTRGVNDEPVDQAPVYLVLSQHERDQGFLRPLRDTYVHVGRPGPTHPLRDLTAEELDRYAAAGYVKFESYESDDTLPSLGRYWKQEQLDVIDKGCGGFTHMGAALAETYARDPHFYGATYCATCRMHRPVGSDGEFVWVERGHATDLRVGA